MTDGGSDTTARLLAQGKSPEQVLDYLANTLTQKLIHTPTARLREASRRGDNEVLALARELLGIKDETR